MSPSRSDPVQRPTGGGGWMTAAPDEVGLDRAPLERLTAAIHRDPEWNVHAVLVERDGLPEHAELATPERRPITLRHALTMSASLQWNEELPYTDPRNDEIAMTASGAAVRYVLSRPIAAEPGTSWNYNGGLTQLLAAAVQRATGQPFRDYARAAVFAPPGGVRAARRARRAGWGRHAAARGTAKEE